MKLIIFDHLKRWGLLWGMLLLTQFFIAGFPVMARGDFHMEILIFQLAVFLGAFQLSVDLQRGCTRVLLVLPVTRKKIALAWWLMSVVAPALALAIATAFGVGVFALVGNLPVLHPEQYLYNCAMTFLWLGSSFFALTGISSLGWQGNWWDKVCMIFFGLLWGLSFGGVSFLFQNVSWENPNKVGAFIAAGTVMTIAGWFRAEQMVVQRGTFRPGIQLGKRQPRQHQAPAGFGGLPFLWGTLFIRVGRMALVFVGVMLLMQVLMHGGSKLSPKQLLEASLPAISTFGYFFTYMFLLLPTIMQLRLLRTLPISATALAATLVLLPVIPILVAGLVWSVFGGVLSGGGNVFQIPTSFLMYAAMTAIGAPFFVWQGMKFGSYLLIMLLVMASTLGPMIVRTSLIPPTLTALISFGLIALAFELTRRLLKSSSRAYQNLPATMTGWGGWGGGR